jgi:hypothetical protein
MKACLDSPVYTLHYTPHSLNTYPCRATSGASWATLGGSRPCAWARPRCARCADCTSWVHARTHGRHLSLSLSLSLTRSLASSVALSPPLSLSRLLSHPLSLTRLLAHPLSRAQVAAYLLDRDGFARVPTSVLVRARHRVFCYTKRTAPVMRSASCVWCVRMRVPPSLCAVRARPKLRLRACTPSLCALHMFL